MLSVTDLESNTEFKTPIGMLARDVCRTYRAAGDPLPPEVWRPFALSLLVLPTDEVLAIHAEIRRFGLSANYFEFMEKIPGFEERFLA